MHMELTKTLILQFRDLYKKHKWSVLLGSQEPKEYSNTIPTTSAVESQELQ